MNIKISLWLFFLIQGTVHSQQKITPENLNTSLSSNNLGLLLDDYYFSWDATNTQKAYHILVASSIKKLEADYGDLWDSGRRESSHSTNIIYKGKKISEGELAYWKVKIWDSDGLPSGFSKPSKINIRLNKTPEKHLRRAVGKSNGNLTFVKGRFGKAIKLGTQEPKVFSYDYPELRPETGTTISAWIQPTKFTESWQCIYRKEDGNDRRLMAIGKEGPFWGLWLGININGYREIGGPIDKEEILNGKWHHVAASFDGTFVKLFHNGQLIAKDKISGKIGSRGESNSFIGSSDGKQEIFEGGLDDLRIYDRGLNEREIKKLSVGENDINASALVGHWKMDDSLDNEVTYVLESQDMNRVTLLGDALISRMEKYGYFETAITSNWPHHDIIFRNIGWPGDDVYGTARAEFDDARNTNTWENGPVNGVGYKILKQQLRDTRPTTVIVGYGSEVAFHNGGISLESFKSGFSRLINELSKEGKKIILLTPPSQEVKKSEVDDLEVRNNNLRQVSNYILNYGNKHGHQVINIFEKINHNNIDPLTDNGVHLNDHGYQVLANLMLKELKIHEENKSQILIKPEKNVWANKGAKITKVVTNKKGVRFDLTPDRLSSDFLSDSNIIKIPSAKNSYALKIDGTPILTKSNSQWNEGIVVRGGPEIKKIKLLRSTIIDKNLQHRRRLRPLNKTYIFLFRSYEMGHLQYEMSDFDRLVAAKEELISKFRLPETHRYSIERVDEWKPVHNDPEHEVPKIIPDPDIKKELESMTVPEGLEVNLFASDPILKNPINMNWDTKGRAWVSMSSTYPHIKPGKEPNDKIVILEDTDNDGVADKSIVFADGLLVPHSVMPVQGGAYVCSATEFLFLADTNGDDRYDEKRIIFEGFGNADVHHMIHSMRWSPWGEIYFNQSIYINSFIETRWGRRRLNGSGVWRFRPESERLEIFARGTVNPWGHAIDKWGQSFITDGAGGQGPHYTFPGAAFRNSVGAPRTLKGLVPGKPNGTGCEIISGRHFPLEWNGSIVENDFRANRTVRYEISESGSGYKAKEVQTLVHSSRQTYRPVDLKMGPDGALYIVDWYNAIIDHGEVDFHHPLRDKSHGRIWRLRAKNSPLIEKIDINASSIEQLLDLLKKPEMHTRNQAKRELVNRKITEVIPKIDTWLGNLSKEGDKSDHHVLEALWLRASLRAPDEKLLTRVLNSKEAKSRAAGVRILSHWFNYIKKPYDLLRKTVKDPNPRVRLETVNALREINSLEATNIALTALEMPSDIWLDYGLWMVARESRNHWLPALQSGIEIFNGDPNQLRFALEAAGDSRAISRLVDLLKEIKIDDQNIKNILKTIAGLGNSKELDIALSIATSNPILLDSIASASKYNESKPKGINKVIPLLSHENLGVRQAAAELAGEWKIKGSSTALKLIVQKSKTPLEQFRAAETLRKIESLDVLESLSKSKESNGARMAALASLAQAKPKEAIDGLIQVLPNCSDSLEFDLLFQSFINREQGVDQLRNVIEKTKLSKSLAIQGVRLARASGRDFPDLISALNHSGNLKSIPLNLSQKQREEIISKIKISGNPKRGAEVYKRKSTACMLCHKIENAGGLVGPDLSSIGSYAQPAAILDSILSPSDDIKQGYETSIITLTDNSIVAGVFQRHSDTSTLVRETSNNMIKIPKDDIVKLEKSPISLMPPGLTSKLRKDELIDLMSFLVNLNGNNNQLNKP